MLNSASDLVPMVMASLKGCPETTAFYGVRRALSMVCRDTGCWRSSISFVVSAITSNEEADSVVIPNASVAVDASISRIMSVRIRKVGVASTVDASKIAMHNYWIKRDEFDAISFDKSVGIETGDTIYLDVALFPPEIGYSSSDIPLGVLYQISSSVVPLAVSLLAEMPGRTWSDPILSQSSMFEHRKSKRTLLFEVLQGGNDSFGETVLSRLVEG